MAFSEAQTFLLSNAFESPTTRELLAEYNVRSEEKSEALVDAIEEASQVYQIETDSLDASTLLWLVYNALDSQVARKISFFDENTTTMLELFQQLHLALQVRVKPPAQT